MMLAKSVWCILLVLLLSVSSVRVNVRDQLANSRPGGGGDGKASVAFSQLESLSANSAQLPENELFYIGQFVIQLVQKATVEASKLRQGRALKTDHAYATDSYGNAIGALYTVNGQPYGDYVWQVGKADLMSLERLATQTGLKLRKVHIVMSRMHTFQDVQQDAFWFAVAAFTDVASGRALFAVSSRGSVGITEWIADIGLFESDVTKHLGFSTWKAVSMVKMLLNSKRVGSAMQIGKQLPELLENQMKLSLLDEVKDDTEQVAALARWNETTGLYASTLLESCEVLAESLHRWSSFSKSVFGGWKWEEVGGPSFITSGASLGGAVSTMVGMRLKLQYEVAGVVGGFSMNSPGVRKLLLKKVPDEKQTRTNAEFQAKVRGVPDAGAGFVNLVAQHDIIWKIGEQIGAGQKVCMYMHPAEDFGCKTGDDKFKKWSKLSDAINIKCAKGVGDSGSMGYLWWAGVTLGMNVFTDLWKCTELFVSPDEDNAPGCWPQEHNFAFASRDNPFSKLVKDETMPLSELMEVAGETFYAGSSRNLTEQSRHETTIARQLAADIAKSNNEWNRKSPHGCLIDASEKYCSVLDDSGKYCKYKEHGNASAEGGSDRTPCESAENTKIVRGWDGKRSCECATGYCFYDGDCVSGPAREALILDVAAKKKMRAKFRTMMEGALDLNMNYKWVCNSE